MNNIKLVLPPYIGSPQEETHNDAYGVLNLQKGNAWLISRISEGSAIVIRSKLSYSTVTDVNRVGPNTATRSIGKLQRDWSAYEL